MADVWVADVRFAEGVVDKLWVKHGLREEEVRRALAPSVVHDATWHDHPQYGRRLIVRVPHPDSNVMIYAILAPIDQAEGIWICKTARRIRN